jgi:putative transposase
MEPSGATRTHPRPGGRPIRHSRREILNGIFYIVRSGSAWKLLPHDLPPRRTVYHCFWSWRRDGTWQIIHDTVRTWVRQAADRKLEPSGTIIDSQTPRPSGQGGTRGYDGPKKVCRRKRHLLVGTLGFGFAGRDYGGQYAGPRGSAHTADAAGTTIPAVANHLG